MGLHLYRAMSSTARHSGIRAFGTDGEEALIKAFGHEFGFSQHFRTCFIHVRRNFVKFLRKLNECHISANVAKVVLDDIFGQHLGATFNEGLVDSSDSDDFRCKLESLLSKWHNLMKQPALQI